MRYRSSSERPRRPSAGSAPANLPRDDFVDRVEELRLLQDALNEPASPALVVVSGDEGIGKTALVRRLMAGLTGYEVRYAACSEDETRLPYGVLGQLLREDTVLPREPDAPLTGAALIGELDAAGRTLVVVDDAQWADPSSLEALSFLLRRPRTAPHVFLLVVRDVADPALPAGIRRTFEADGVLRLRLAGLDERAVADLYTVLRGCRPAARTALRLRRHTGGNPLHLRSLLMRLTAETLEDPGLPLPAPKVLAVKVLGVLARCGSACQDLVSAAAVLGERCPLHLAAAVAGAGDPLPALDEAVAAGLLLEEIGAGELVFPDPLTRTAVYQDHLRPSRRAVLHRRAAGLVQDPAAALWHRGAAALGPDTELAAGLAEQGRLRVADGAWGEAARYLGAAARLAPSAGERQRFTLEAAEVRVLMGHSAGLLPQVSALPPSAWREYVLALLKLDMGRTADAGALLTEAWCRSAGSDATLAARVAAQHALLRLLEGDHRAAATWSERGRALADGRLPEPSGLARSVAACVAGLTGGAEEMLATLAELPAPASASAGDLEALLGRAMVRMWTDDLAGAAADLDGILAAEDRLPIRARVLARAAAAETDYRRGAWDDALAHCESAVRAAGDAGHALLSPACHAIAVLVLAARGEWETAEAHLSLTETPAPAGTAHTAYVGAAAVHLAAARGAPEAVVAAGRRAAAAYCGLSWTDLLADALTATGRTDEAGAVLTAWEATVRNTSERAAAARARGNLHAALREPAAAHAFEHALGLLGGLDMPYPLALTELDYGAYLRRQGKRGQAAERLERAHATLEALGARPALERCARELAACGIGQRRGSGPSDAELTCQELAVAGHAARGLTNRQIARELAVSVKTVEYHLGHVYLKLRIRSRTQLALRLAR